MIAVGFSVDEPKINAVSGLSISIVTNTAGIRVLWYERLLSMHGIVSIVAGDPLLQRISAEVLMKY
ncbi:MAG TPA: hypothetical protein VF145_01025, partial [Chitinophagaceae bacterium]